MLSGMSLTPLYRTWVCTLKGMGDRNHIDASQDLSPGDTFVAKIDRIKSSRVGIIERDTGQPIKAGPVTCIPDQSVQFEYIKPRYARCLDQSIQAENYDVRFKLLTEQYEAVPVAEGEEYTGEVVNVFAENAKVAVEGVHVNIEETEVDIGEKVFVRVTGFTSQSANGKFVERTDEGGPGTDQDHESENLDDLMAKAKK